MKERCTTVARRTVHAAAFRGLGATDFLAVLLSHSKWIHGATPLMAVAAEGHVASLRPRRRSMSSSLGAAVAHSRENGAAGRRVEAANEVRRRCEPPEHQGLDRITSGGPLRKHEDRATARRPQEARTALLFNAWADFATRGCSTLIHAAQDQAGHAQRCEMDGSALCRYQGPRGNLLPPRLAGTQSHTSLRQ